MSVASPFPAAPQHGPRPLPLFLDLLRSETAASPDLQAAALRGLARYQAASRAGIADRPPIGRRVGRAGMRDYGGDGPAVVVVPSLINPSDVLDLLPENSLVRFLRAQGLRPLLLDWGIPDKDDAGIDVAGHVETLLAPLLAGFDRPPLLVGYCLGGTMALAAAALVPVAGVATIATPWRFDGFPPPARARIARLWADAQPACAALGLLPMEVLQAGFWQLDPAGVVAKYAAFAAMPADDPQARSFVAVEDWANGGAPLTLAAGRELFEDFLARDRPGRGAWRVGGRTIDPAALGCPHIDFVAHADRIVPAASACGAPDTRSVAAGHVGMIVGRGARARLWRPLADFLLDPERATPSHRPRPEDQP